MAKLVSKVYGDALFETAIEKDLMDVLFAEVCALVPVLQENPDLFGLLGNPQVGKEEKLSIINQIFFGRISTPLEGFLNIIVQKNRHNDILPIFEYFIERVKEHKRIGAAYVTSAVELSSEQKASLERKLLDSTSYVTFEMHYQVDPEIIGGLIIRIGDHIVDSSIQTRIYELKKDLSKIQLA